MYKTIEYIFKLRMERIAQEDPKLLRKFELMYTNSGLCAPDTIKKIMGYV